MKADSHTDDQAPSGGSYTLATGTGSRSKAAAATTTGKRKPSISETPESVETDEQKQKRARGRPRLDTKDETAADRRRTQIRLAQRAYRHRKDNAITSLEDRVQFLEKNNADMSREFHRFFDLVISENLLDVSSEVASRFRAITDNFLRLSGMSAGETRVHLARR
ncbi:hypothetical protein NQ176_g5216 [Zarea fungicola]|uniref:Uncharacterized protein n=1 Tax=Zarea fungicola TaxID=93591 RepID=A0ACC1NC01_9HYPO|nr:hypothetical protein NQ176_g5216 [Lecanicillium fungicola]